MSSFGTLLLLLALISINQRQPCHAVALPKVEEVDQITKEVTDDYDESETDLPDSSFGRDAEPQGIIFRGSPRRNGYGTRRHRPYRRNRYGYAGGSRYHWTRNRYHANGSNPYQYYYLGSPYFFGRSASSSPEDADLSLENLDAIELDARLRAEDSLCQELAVKHCGSGDLPVKITVDVNSDFFQAYRVGRLICPCQSSDQ